MIILVEGKEKSGKSRVAEGIFRAFKDEGYYIATMIPYGDYGEEIIRRHRKLRDDLSLVTVESPYLDDVSMIPKGSRVILEDISNLVANHFFNRKEKISEYLHCLDDLISRCSELIIVGMRDISDDTGASYDDETQRYIHEIDSFMDYLETISDIVIYLENGIIKYKKGSELRIKRKDEK